MPALVSHVVEGLSYLVNAIIHVIYNGNPVGFGQMLEYLVSWQVESSFFLMSSVCTAESLSQDAGFISLLGLVMTGSRLRVIA